MSNQFPQQRTRVLIVGAGEAGQELALRLKHRFPEHRFDVVGFIDDDPAKRGMYVEGSPVLGDRHAIVRLSADLAIDLIVVAIHNISGSDFRDILGYCEQTKAVIKVLPNLYALVNGTEMATALRDVQPEDLIGRKAITRHEGVDLTPLMGKTILVTGAAGSSGSELSRQALTYDPLTLVLVDNNESGLHDLQVELQAQYPSIEIVPALVDVSLRSSVRAVMERYHPQLIFHAAAYKHVPMLEYYPVEALRVNIIGTRNLAELAAEYAVERFVLISTDKAVEPSSVMGATKRVCELMLQALGRARSSGTLFTSVRFGNVLGSRGSVVLTFNRQIDHGGPVTVTHPDMTRYFMSIAEAVNLILHAACLTQGDEVFILRMGEVVKIVELAERMIRLRGLRPYQDIAIAFTGVRPGEKLHESLFNTTEKPTETAHPDIVQIRDAAYTVDPEALWQAVDGLIAQMDDAGQGMLARLLNVIQAATQTAPEPALQLMNEGQ